MRSVNILRITIGVILGIVLVSLAVKLTPISKNLDDFFAEEMYQVTYRFFLKTDPDRTKVHTYLPKNNGHQRISNEKNGASVFWSFWKKCRR